MSAYRSDLEAALARLDAMEPRAPCRACARRSSRYWKALDFVGKVMIGLIVSIVAALVAVTLVGIVLAMMWRPAFG